MARAPLLALALLAPLAAPPALAAVPAALRGEWFAGAVYPGATYTPDAFRAANASTRRLDLRADGTYELAVVTRTAVPGSFGAYTISCESLGARWERGTYAVKGDALTLTPKTAHVVNGASPNALNNGCTRHRGLPSDPPPGAPRTLTWTAREGVLGLASTGGRDEYRRATAGEKTPPAAPAAKAPSAPAPRTPLPGERRPVPRGAAGRWTARLVTDGGAPLDARIVMDDDRLGVAGVVYSPGGDVLGSIRGDSASGRLELTFDLAEGEVLFRTEGRFGGDRYDGRFRAYGPGGAELGGGKVELERN